MGGDVGASATASREAGERSSRSAVAARDEAVRWMNHGCDLSLRGDGAGAIAAYARAIALLRPLPLGTQPAWANSFGAALMNHGQLLHRVHGIARSAEALESCAEAIAVLAAIPAEVVPWARRNLAGTYINRANLLLDVEAAGSSSTAAASGRGSGGVGFQHSVTDARAALALVVAVERADPVDADLALKARRVWCDALGQQLVFASRAQQDALASEAADLVDDALAVVRYWTTRGESAFAELAVRFFRFGTELYRQHQPHFLVEFIEENLRAAPAQTDEMRVVAHLALEQALADGSAPALLTLDDPVAERALHTREAITRAYAQLAQTSAASGGRAASAAI